MRDLIHGFKDILWNWLTIPIESPGLALLQFITYCVLTWMLFWVLYKIVIIVAAIVKIIAAQTRTKGPAKAVSIEEQALRMYGPVPEGCTVFFGNLSTGELVTHDGFIEIEHERYLHPSELSDPDNTLQIAAMSAAQATRKLKDHISKNGKHRINRRLKTSQRGTDNRS